MKNQSLSFQLLSALLIVCLVLPAPLFAGPEDAPSAAPSIPPAQTWVVPKGEQNPKAIADGLEMTLRTLKEQSNEDFAIVFHHLSTSTEDGRLLETAQELQNRGITVTGSVETPQELEARITSAIVGENGLAAALNIKLDRESMVSSLGRFIKKIGKITFWTHIQKWKTQDWDRTTFKTKAVTFGYSFLAGSIAAAWFLFSAAATGSEAAFATELSRAAGEFMNFNGVGDTFGALLDMGKSFGNLSPTSMAAAGLLTMWVVGYQTFFTAINSFRRQWLSPNFDPSRPAGEQLILGEEKGYNRFFFFLASFGLEMLICTGMLSIFGGGDINGTLLWVAAYTSVYSSMGYMPAETLAGTFNQRSAEANRLYHKHLDQNGKIVDDLAVVLDQAVKTNKTLELLTRYLWWDTLYPAMRNATLLGASGAIGNVLQYGLMGFFGFGTAIDVNNTRGSLMRWAGNWIRRIMGYDTAQTATCSDWIEFRALTSAKPKE